MKKHGSKLTAIFMTALMLFCAFAVIGMNVEGASSRAAESEANNDINHANTISSDEIVTGDLVIDAGNGPGNMDVQDWFMISASRGEVINVSLYHLDWNPADTGQYNIQIFLLGPETEGSLNYVTYWFSSLRTRWETASCLVTFSAVHFVAVVANMTLDSNNNPIIVTDPVHYTMSATVATPPTLTIGTNDNKVLDIDSPNWHAWYKIGGNPDQSFVARLNNPTGTNIDMDLFNMWMRGFDKAAGYQGYQPFSLNRSYVDQTGNNEQMGGRIGDGEGYIRLWLREGGGQYTLNLQQAQMADDGNNRPDIATLVEKPQSIVARADQSYDHFDWYKFTLQSGESVDITLTLEENRNHYWNLSIWDSAYNYVDGWFNTQDGSHYRNPQDDHPNPISMGGINKPDWTPTAPGTYYVMVMPIASDPDQPRSSFPSSQQYRLFLNLPNYGPFVVTELADDEIDEDGVFTGLDLSDHFGDPEGDPLTYNKVSQTDTNVVVTLQGSNVTMTPKANWFGECTVVFSATDGGANMGETTVQSEMTLTVNPVNDDPYLVMNFGDYTIPENSKNYQTGRKLDDIFADIDDDTLTYSYSGNSKVIVILSPTTSEVAFTVPDLWFGKETITFTAKDSGTNPVSTDCNVTVTHFNHLPNYIKESYSVDIDEDEEDHSLNIEDMFDDPDLHYTVDTGEELSYRIKEPLPDHINVSIDPDDYTLHVIPDANWSGDDDIVIVCTDAASGSNTTKIFITVEPVNDPPEIVQTTPATINLIEMDEGDAETFSVVSTDIDNDTKYDLKYRWYVNGEQVTGENVKHNQFTFRTAYTSEIGTGFDEGSYVVKVVVTDGLLEDETEWNVEVNDVNQAPEGAEIITPKSTDEVRKGNPLIFEAGNATDIDGDDLTYTWWDKTTNQSIGEGQTLDYDWGTGPLAPGEHTIELIISDGELEIKSTVKINIKKKKASSDPGFEMIAVVAALSIVVVALRRRRK